MSDIQQVIRFEAANSAVAFREHAYDKSARQELLRDLLGLANAEVKGPRFLIVGIRDSLGGAREIPGISEPAAASLHEFCKRLAADFIEPALQLRIEETIVDAARVLAIVLPECDDPPYLLRKTASNTMRTGSGWIRRGTQFSRMTRADLQRIFEAKLLSRSASAEIRIGFAGRLLEQVLHLPVMRLEQMPSKAARFKLRKMLAARQVSEDQNTQDRTRIQRLVHAQLFGLDQAYESHSERSLLERLEHARDEHEAADRHYEYEIRAHKINLVLENVGSAPFENGTLVLDIPRMDGVEVADRVWPAPDRPRPASQGYPTVDVGSRTSRVQAVLAPIQPGARGAVFQEPLRLCLREPAIAKVIPISFGLYGRSLRAPISGALRIYVEDEKTLADRPSKRA